jgi:hypothetical protein
MGIRRKWEVMDLKDHKAGPGVPEWAPVYNHQAPTAKEGEGL